MYKVRKPSKLEQFGKSTLKSEKGHSEKSESRNEYEVVTEESRNDLHHLNKNILTLTERFKSLELEFTRTQESHQEYITKLFKEDNEEIHRLKEEIRTIREEHCREIKIIREEHSQEMTAIREEHSREMTAIRNEHSQKVNKFQEDMKNLDETKKKRSVTPINT
jgi:archaellum component FlaC